MTGRAASMSISSTPGRRCRRRCAAWSRAAKASARPATSAWSISCAAAARSPARWRWHMSQRRAGHHRRQGDDRRHRRAHAALPPQQRLRQHGRRRLCAGVARRRAADRHGVRAVLPDRASCAAADRHGPDHVGPVPLQARRPAAQQRGRGVHRPLRRAARTATTSSPAMSRTYAIVKEVEAGRGSPHGGAYLSFQHCSEATLRAGVRAGDRPARRRTASTSPRCRSRSRRSRITTWAASSPTNAWQTEIAGPSRRGRGGRRRQRRQPAVRQRHHRGAGVRPPRRPQRRRARQAHDRAFVRAASGARTRSILSPLPAKPATLNTAAMIAAPAGDHGRRRRPVPHRGQAQARAR